MRAFYSCGLCGLLDQQVTVKPRAAGQGVVEWSEQMLDEVRAHHSLASPNCHPTKLDNVKVPVDPDADGIGYEPVAELVRRGRARGIGVTLTRNVAKP